VRASLVLLAVSFAPIVAAATAAAAAMAGRELGGLQRESALDCKHEIRISNFALPVAADLLSWRPLRRPALPPSPPALRAPDRGEQTRPPELGPPTDGPAQRPQTGAANPI